jgi:hypothetical protein
MDQAVSYVRGKDVYILGAGFSRAVHDDMPLLKDLSRLVAERYRHKEYMGGRIAEMIRADLEEGMSYLVAAKPWLREAEILRHRALFLDLSVTVAAVLTELMGHVIPMLAAEVPPWLDRLIRNWHKSRATVITMNYDTLIEAAAREVVIDLKGQKTGIWTHAVYPSYLADAAQRNSTVFIDHMETFRLLKLHGSTNWYYSGTPNARGETIFFVPPLGPAKFWSADARAEHEQRLEAVADKYPLIIPPIFDKAAMMSHETLQSIWFQAGKALEAAERVTFAGYSIPESDRMMAHFISEKINSAATIRIFNPDKTVLDRYARILGRPAESIELNSGVDCVLKMDAAPAR